LTKGEFYAFKQPTANSQQPTANSQQPTANILFRKIKHIVKRLLTVLPFGKRIVALIGNNWAFKRNFGKIRFQGQFFQDMIAYMYLPKKKDGFYIDIGANDGLMSSNTYIFEQIGWKGICVEPQPNIFKYYLKKFRNCDCYNVALSSHSNENVEFFQAYGANALSGLNEGMSEAHKNWAKEYGKVEIIKVKTMIFSELMEKYPSITEIDFMSIDVEGHEMEILKTIDFEKYKFKLITIEKSEPEKIKNYMKEKGYKLFMEIGVDIMFIPKTE
jgi:FkbM family methyltransferase